MISATSANTFPVAMVTSLTENGSVVSGASVPYSYQSAADASAQSFTIPLAVSDVPAALQVTETGGSYLADAVTITVTRQGDLPA